MPQIGNARARHDTSPCKIFVVFVVSSTDRKRVTLQQVTDLLNTLKKELREEFEDELNDAVNQINASMLKLKQRL